LIWRIKSIPISSKCTCEFLKKLTNYYNSCKVSKSKLGRIFLISTLIPYSLVLFLTVFFLYGKWKTLSEYETIRKNLKPLIQLTEIITNLNRLKSNFVLETYGFSNSTNCNLNIKKLIESLNSQIKNRQILLRLCNCKNIYLLEGEILQFLQNLPTDIPTFIHKTDNLIYRLNHYYLNLSSKLRIKNVADFARTFYFLNQQRTILEDFFVWNLVYLQEENPYVLNLYPYLKGLFIAYSDSYTILLDNRKLEEIYSNEILETAFIKSFLKNIYQNEELLLTDHNNFEKDFFEYRKFVTGEMVKIINDQITRLYLEIVLIIATAFVALVFFAFIHYRLYARGVSSVNRTLQILKYRSSYDTLTHLLSRREFHNFLFRKIPYETRKGEKWSLILLDLDNFKKINDTFGHDFGDKVLKHVANLIKKNIRNQDFAFRWGGEEFAIFIKGNKEEAYRLAERLRKAIETSPINGIKITASFGVGEYSGGNPLRFFHKVDQALYKAKKLGKNRVEIVND